MKERIKKYLETGLMVASLAVGMPAAFVIDSGIKTSRAEAVQVRTKVREDLVTVGDTNQDGVLDLYETRSLLDKLGYDGIVEPGIRISVYSLDSGEGVVYRRGDYVRVPLDRAKSALEEIQCRLKEPM